MSTDDKLLKEIEERYWAFTKTLLGFSLARDICNKDVPWLLTEVKRLRRALRDTKDALASEMKKNVDEVSH